MERFGEQQYNSGMDGNHVSGLRCMRCGAWYAPGTPIYVCTCRPNAGSDIGTLNVEYDYAGIARSGTLAQIAADTDRSIGRYWRLLPIAARTSLPPLAVGGTPLMHVPRLGAALGLRRLLIKDDGRNPSASLKDRASAIAVARAREEGRGVVATASTGNAAAALAGQSAAAGQANVIFVPRSAPPAKIAQLLVYGSVVLAVDGSYDEAFDLCALACAEFGWYNRSTGYNPYMTEGKKSVAFEIAEQTAAWLTQQGELPAGPMAAPDAVFVSVGDGCIIGGVHKGFKDLLQLGWIDKLPRLYGVQSTRSAALASAWRAGLDVPEPVRATTRADSINVDAPRDPIKALAAVRESGGAFITVEDEAILGAILPLARLGAVFAEPAGAAAYAGVAAAVREGLVQPNAVIVAINTGSGLKDIRAAMDAAGEPMLVAPELDAVRDVLAARHAELGIPVG